MTGAARRVYRSSGNSIDIYVKSVNQKHLEVSCRLPGALRSIEDRIHFAVSEQISRGRVEVFLQSSSSFQSPELDEEVMKSYYTLLSRMGRRESLDPLVILQLPGVSRMKDEQPSWFDPEQFLQTVSDAVTALKKARRKEGRGLQKQILDLLSILQKYSREIEGISLKNRKEFPGAFLQQMERNGVDLKSISAKDISPQLLEWYDRSNIAEELERLSLHVKECREIIRNEEDAGRRLEFFAQELLREVNTIGAKSRDFEIRRRVVEMKNAIEKMKEQVRNIC